MEENPRIANMTRKTRKVRQYTYAPAAYPQPRHLWRLAVTASPQELKTDFSTLPCLAHKQRTETDQSGEQAEDTSNPELSKCCQIYPRRYKYFHGHKIAPSRNGNHASNRLDFHSIPTLNTASSLDWLQPYLGSTLYMKTTSKLNYVLGKAGS